MCGKKEDWYVKKWPWQLVVLALRDGMCPYWKGARVEGPTGTSSALPAAPTQSATERRCMPTVFVDMPTAMCAPLLHTCRRNMPQPSRHDDEDERGTTGGGTRGERSGRGHGAGRRGRARNARAAGERRRRGERTATEGVVTCGEGGQMPPAGPETTGEEKQGELHATVQPVQIPLSRRARERRDGAIYSSNLYLAGSPAISFSAFWTLRSRSPAGGIPYLCSAPFSWSAIWMLSHAA